MANRWVTPDGDAPGTVARRRALLIPDDDQFEACVLGALNMLTEPYNWEQVLDEDMTAEEAAEHMQTMLLLFIAGVDRMLGELHVIAGTNTAKYEPYYLPADGRSLSAADYPALFAEIGYTYGGAGATFNIPDVRDKVVLGASATRPAGTTGGEETHTLTTSEMPAHTHGYVPAGANATTIGPGVPEPTAIPSVGVTDSAGGGIAHNNMQPFVAFTVLVRVV